MAAQGFFPAWWWVFVLLLFFEAVFVYYMENHLGLKAGFPTKLSLAGLAFVFAPAFLGEEDEDEPIASSTLSQAERTARAERLRRQRKQAIKKAKEHLRTSLGLSVAGRKSELRKKED
jgi:hypothetical protein